MHRSGSSTGPQEGAAPGAVSVPRRRGESRAGGKSSGFAPTGAWFFVLLVAALLFVVGVARSEPAAAISGGFFLVVLVLFAVSNTLAFIVVSRRLSRGGGFHLSPRISAADEGETRILALTVDPEARSLTILSPLLSYRLSTDPLPAERSRPISGLEGISSRTSSAFPAHSAAGTRAPTSLLGLPTFWDSPKHRSSPRRFASSSYAR